MAYKLDSISDEEAKHQANEQSLGTVTFIDRVRFFMREFGAGNKSPVQLQRALDHAGLKIIEKGQ